MSVGKEMYDYLIVGAGLFGSVNIRQSTPVIWRSRRLIW